MWATLVNRLFYRYKQPIGIDISQASVKVMAINPVTWTVQAYGSLELDPTKVQAALDMSEKGDAFLSRGVQTLLDEHVIGTLPSRHAVVGVPSSKAFSRTFSLPLEDAEHLEDALEVEISQHIPLPQSALYVDYDVIDRNETSVKVTMSALPRSVVDACMIAVRSAGLRPIMVEPSAYSVARILQLTEDGQLSTVVVDINQAQTDISILEKGFIRVSGGVPVGGNTFTIDIAQKLNISLDNAHQLKIINGLAPSPKQHALVAALDTSLRRIVTEIEKVIRYYNERVDESVKIEQLIVVGAGSNLPGIGEYFTDALVMPARVASPWRKFSFGKLTPLGKHLRPRYITVAGLASVAAEETIR